MRSHRPTSVLLVALAVATAMLAGPAAPRTAGAAPGAAPIRPGEVFTGNLPDPHVLKVGHTYYAYGTMSGGPNIPVLKSHDLSTWIGVGDALPQIPSWAERRDLWAPGVARIGGRYRLYYTAPHRASGKQCISVASSSSPAGPFVDRSSGPLVCQVDLNGSIDPSPFVDSDGKAWLIWKSEGRTDGEETKIWSQRLVDGGLRLSGARTRLLQRDQEWERPVIENPSMIRYRGYYYLFYSASLWSSARYGVSYAVCWSVTGPCFKVRNGPILTSHDSVMGPGGASAFVDGSRRLRLAYHAWTAPHIGYPEGARRLRLATLTGGIDDLAVVGLGRPGSGGAAVGITARELGAGYRIATASGRVAALGLSRFHGSLARVSLTKPVVGIVETPSGNGYWMLGRDGGVFSFGDAPFFGSTGGLRLNQPVVGMAPHPSGRGYWFVAADGGVFSYGAARFHGSTGDRRLNQPIVGMAATPTGRGYWLVARDGGIFAFGDARFHGSTGAIRLNQPVVAMARTVTGRGYWFVAADGGIFAFGDARFRGSTGDRRLSHPIVGMAAAPSGGGYWLLARDGGIFAFGDAPFLGRGVAR